MDTSQFPRNVVRNFNLFVGHAPVVSLCGQCTKAQIKWPKRKTEELFNAGMHMGLEIAIGAYEKAEFDFTITGLLPEIIGLHGYKIGTDFPFLLAAAGVDEGTGRVWSNQLSGFGFVKEFDMDEFEAHGKKHEQKFQLSPREVRWERDGVEMLHFSPFDIRVRGVSQTVELNRAMLLA